MGDEQRGEASTPLEKKLSTPKAFPRDNRSTQGRHEHASNRNWRQRIAEIATIRREIDAARHGENRTVNERTVKLKSGQEQPGSKNIKALSLPNVNPVTSSVRGQITPNNHSNSKSRTQSMSRSESAESSRATNLSSNRTSHNQSVIASDGSSSEAVEECERLRLQIERFRAGTDLDELEDCWRRAVYEAQKSVVEEQSRQSPGVHGATEEDVRVKLANKRLQAVRLAAAGSAFRLAGNDPVRLRAAAVALEEALEPKPKNAPENDGCRTQSRVAAMNDGAVNSCQLRLMDLIIALKHLGRGVDAQTWWRRAIKGEILSYAPQWKSMDSIHRQLPELVVKPLWDSIDFAWASTLEQHTADIRTELMQLLASGVRFHRNRSRHTSFRHECWLDESHLVSLGWQRGPMDRPTLQHRGSDLHVAEAFGSQRS